MIRSTHLLALSLLGVLAACSSESANQQPNNVSTAATMTVPSLQGADVTGPPSVDPLPPMTVHKSPSCGCCGLWVDHAKRAGFSVSVVSVDDLNPLKLAMGVPVGGGSCHTAIVGGYFIEGHVPAADIQRLLTERPKARGLTVPGMALGSPGMEVPTGEVQPYTVYLVDLDGKSTPFSHHNR
jgi:hypothetical protein